MRPSLARGVAEFKFVTASNVSKNVIVGEDVRILAKAALVEPDRQARFRNCPKRIDDYGKQDAIGAAK